MIIGGSRKAGNASPGDARVVSAVPGARFAGIGPGRAELGSGTAEGLSAHIQADWDRAALEGTQITSVEQWRSIVAADRVCEVRGGYALAAIGGEGSSVALWRDPIGERSLYYALDDGRFRFASSLHALLATRLVAPRLDYPALAAYLACAFVPTRRTLVQGVYKVLPGERVRFENNRLEREQFYRLPGEGAGEEESEHKLRSILRGELEAAVRNRLPEGGSVGASLSGGIDSSLVVTLAARLHQGPLHTYSISFGDRYRNELEFSSLVAATCGTSHTIVEISPQTILHHFDDTMRALSDPVGDPLTVPNALLFREAACDVSAVLNGEGGDPCFGGPKNGPMLLAEVLGDGRNRRAQRDFKRESSYLRSYGKCYDDLPAMLSPHVRQALADDPIERWFAPYFSDSRWPSFVNKLMAINIRFKGTHHILSKLDHLSRPFGIQPRSPLFDRSIVDLSFRMPARLKLRGNVEKYLLKRAVADLLPPEIVDRPKCGMLVPVEHWFQGPLRKAARERLLDGLTPYQIIERSYLEQLIGGKLAEVQPRRGEKIWLLMTLESWLRSVFGDSKLV